jgi:hypothetical protein
MLHQCFSLHTDTAEAQNPPHLVYTPYLGPRASRLYCGRETSKKEQAADFLFPSASILNHIYFHFLLTIPICMLFFSISRTTVMFSSVYLTQSFFVTDSFNWYTDCQVRFLLFCFLFVSLLNFHHFSSSILPHTILPRPPLPISHYFLINPSIKLRQHPFLPYKIIHLQYSLGLHPFSFPLLLL